MVIKIPTQFRSGGFLKPCDLGTDLPAWFVENIRSIDNKIYPIFHPYKVMWEDIMTNNAGNEDDPRFVIGTYPGAGTQEFWGHPLLQSKRDGLAPNGNWHLWRLCNIGWAHILELDIRGDVAKENGKESMHNDPLDYLKFVLDEMHKIAQITDKNGPGAANEYLRESDEAFRAKEHEDKKQLMNDTMKENKGIMRKVIENYNHGIIKASNPVKETISSFNSQTNKSRIIRPLDDSDRESGLILPKEFIN